MMRTRSILGAVTLAAPLIVLVQAQGPTVPARIDPLSSPVALSAAKSGANIRINSTLVLVPVSVVDGNNRPVTGLELEHFKLLDEKVEQQITQFSMDDAPVDVGLVFDTSGSMGPKLRRSRMAANAFFQTSNPEDQFFLATFSDNPKLVCPLGADPADIQNQLTFTGSHGRTALLDAIALAMHELKKSTKERKALLIISDGGDNSSRYTEGEIRNMVRESDVLIYAIGIFEPGGGRDRSPEEAGGPGLLNDLAEMTGGREFEVDNLNELPDVAAKIGIELRNRYVLGYRPAAQSRDGKYHHVQVKLVPPKGMPQLKAHWRPGYFAPVE